VSGGFEPHLQRGIAVLEEDLAGMPDSLADVGGDLGGEQEPDPLGFLSVRDPEILAALAVSGSAF